MNYSDIVRLALAYTDREATRSGIETRIDDFLRLVEARLNRLLATEKMVKTVSIARVVDATTYALPADFLSIRQLAVMNTVTGKKMDLQYVSPEQQTQSAANYPPANGYTIVGTNLELRPLAEDNVLSLSYMSYVTPLTEAAPTNWMSLQHPDCYVYGLAAEICVYVKDTEAYQTFFSRYNDATNEISFLDDTATHSGTALQTRVG